MPFTCPHLYNDSSSCKYLGGANHLPGPVLGAVHTLLNVFYSHSPMRLVLLLAHFTDEEVVAEQGYAIY